MNRPLSFAYDPEHDILTVEGVRYSGALFREWSKHGMEVGQLFMLQARSEDGQMFTIQRIREPSHV